MPLDADTCYRAIASRDRRFDGHFIVGVRTTGVYCRPGCPARTPLRRNVDFYACAAAAERAGLRPCRRCRPDATPGTVAANLLGTPATVARALRLIRAGALSGADATGGHGVESLAARLGMSGRHLRALFEQHLGCSPLALAKSERLHLAKKLIEETTLPMSEIAYAAGFGSVRRFNDAIQGGWATSPTALRTARRAPPGEALTLRLPFRPPYDGARLLGFLAARAIPGVEAVGVGNRRYRRTIAVGASSSVTGVLDVQLLDDHARVMLTLDHSVELLDVVARVRRVFDLDADPRRVAAVLRADRSPSGKRMAERVRRRPGLRVPGAWDGFELAVRAILGQQVSVQAATTLCGRLVARFGTPLDGAAPLTHLFPTPAQLADADVAQIGLPSARGRAVQELARAVFEHPFLALDGWLDAEAATTALTALPGIGPWTAQYIAMRMGQPDAFAAGDLVLRRRAGVPNERALLAQTEAWRPFRAYAALQLWADDGDGDEESKPPQGGVS